MTTAYVSTILIAFGEPSIDAVAHDFKAATHATFVEPELRQLFQVLWTRCERPCVSSFSGFEECVRIDHTSRASEGFDLIVREIIESNNLERRLGVLFRTLFCSNGLIKLIAGVDLTNLDLTDFSCCRCRRRE